MNYSFSAGCVTNSYSSNGDPLTANRCSTDPLMSSPYDSSDRNVTMEYDDLGRLTFSELSTNEPTNVDPVSSPASIVRSFTNSFDDDDGIYTTTDQDGDSVVVELDAAGRTGTVTRTVDLSPNTRTIVAEYTYDAAGRVTRVDQGNGNCTLRSYDDANRLKSIVHTKLGGALLLKQEYAWSNDGLIKEIIESDEVTVPTETITATLTYEYDNRNRLIREIREDSGATGVAAIEFDIEYTYDQGGNRLTKVDNYAGHTTTYTYDVHVAGADDGYQHNNRLLYQETEDVGSSIILEKRWYEYDSIGNLYRLIRNQNTTNDEIFWFYYDTSGKLWMSVYGMADYDDEEQELDNITLISAAEYRYDGGRQRYMVRLRDPNDDYEVVGDAQWRDYLGDDFHRDYSVAPSTGTVTNADSYLVGVGYDSGETDDPKYIYGDQIGTTRRITDSATTPALLHRKISTSFGEPVSTVNAGGFDHPRYGYAGAYGYEEPRSGDPLELLSWLHVGERYYAPELGRFVQRDPIGIRGGLNTYVYVQSAPVSAIDPSGLTSYTPYNLLPETYGQMPKGPRKFAPNRWLWVYGLGCTVARFGHWVVGAPYEDPHSVAISIAELEYEKFTQEERNKKQKLAHPEIWGPLPPAGPVWPTKPRIIRFNGWSIPSGI